MPLLRFAYVLALAVWLGGMIVLGAVVAPALFSTLGALDPVSGRLFAGEGFGAVLQRFHYLAYGAGGILLVSLSAMALLGPRPRSFAVRTVIVATMLAVAVYSGVIVLGEIDSIQSGIAESTPSLGTGEHTVAATHRLPSSLPAGDARRIRFDLLHVLSTRLMMFNIVAGLVLLAWEARDTSR